MWLSLSSLSILLTATISSVAATPNRALLIDIASDGRAIDAQAIGKIRTISSDALAIGTIDNFVVNVPKIGGPISREGGLSACVEKGFSAKQFQFNAYIKQLKSIKPRTGTLVKIKSTESCMTQNTYPAFCGGIAHIKCAADQQLCFDDPRDECDPKLNGADCSGICLLPN